MYLLKFSSRFLLPLHVTSHISRSISRTRCGVKYRGKKPFDKRCKIFSVVFWGAFVLVFLDRRLARHIVKILNIFFFFTIFVFLFFTTTTSRRVDNVARKFFAVSYSKIARCRVSISERMRRRKRDLSRVLRPAGNIVHGGCVCLRCVTKSHRKCHPWSPPFGGWACAPLIIISLINMQNGAGAKGSCRRIFSPHSVDVHTLQQ